MQYDWAVIFQIEWNLAFLLSLLNIIFINLVLSGDNAVLIAMAVRNLPKRQRMKGITIGSAVAIILRVILTYFVGILLELNFIKLIGGILLLWIAIKLFMEADEGRGEDNPATTLSQAIKVILIADFTMSLDNVLAVAGVADGNLFLLIAGLALSIPTVIFTSNLLSTLMDKYPIIIIIGGAILGKVGGAMIITDPFINKWLNPSQVTEFILEAVCTVGVVAVGKIWMTWNVVSAERTYEIATLSQKAESQESKKGK